MQAEADSVSISQVQPEPRAGRLRTRDCFGSVRERRECPRRRRAGRVILGGGRGNRRGPLAREGRGVDLRPRYAGRTGIRSGREGLIVLLTSPRLRGEVGSFLRSG